MALSSSVPGDNMSDDLLDKMALSMELNVLNKPLLVLSTANCSNCRFAAHQQVTPWRILRVRSLTDHLMSHHQRRPRLVLIQTKVCNQCDHFPLSQLNPWMICPKILLKILLFLRLIRLLAWTCQRIPVWTYRRSQSAWTWNCATPQSHDLHKCRSSTFQRRGKFWACT